MVGSVGKDRTPRKGLFLESKDKVWASSLEALKSLRSR